MLSRVAKVRENAVKVPKNVLVGEIKLVGE